MFGLAVAGAIRGATPPAPVSLTGAIDFHCHSGPDTTPRSINSFEAVRQARAADLRGLVLKSHFMPTAPLAQLAMEEVPGIEVFGGVVLNRSMGGPQCRGRAPHGADQRAPRPRGVAAHLRRREPDQAGQGEPSVRVRRSRRTPRARAGRGFSNRGPEQSHPRHGPLLVGLAP